MQLLLLSSLLATAVLAEVPTAAHQEIAGDAIARPVLITSVAPVSTPTLSFTTSLASEVTTKKAGVLCQLCIDEVLALINEVRSHPRHRVENPVPCYTCFACVFPLFFSGIATTRYALGTVVKPASLC